MIDERLGPYEILEPLGKGGMGEVWLARDTRLERQVAIKVLPEELAGDPERLARLRREARLLAQLDHPNVAAVYGLEEEEGATFLVMQYAEGRTLAALLADGPLEVDGALAVALQIVEALEAAHERGVVHRDLKPGNVHVTFDADGQPHVKVLDFGLAKLYGPDGPEAEISPEITGSPTVMATRAGVILGTAAYMSPEQARGGAVDKRTDIWAFGCVLYEMLAGRRAFEGDTVTDVIAAIVKDDPDWSGLPEEIPPPVDRLLRRCLLKRSRQRLRDIGEARIVLESAVGEPGAAVDAGPAILAGTGDTVAAAPATGWAGNPRVAWIVAAVATLLAALAGWSALWSPAPEPSPGGRFTVTVPADAPLVLAPLGTAVQISPDGTRLVFVGRRPLGLSTRGLASQLYVRPLDSLEARPIPGTEGAIVPFFSPDGDRIGFFTGESLQTVELDGGATPRTLTSTRAPRGAAWGPDGTIVYAEWPGDGGLLQVPEAGGDPEPLTELDADADEISHRHPEFVPGGRFVLFTILRGTVSSADDMAVGIFDRETEERRVLLEGGIHARHAASGHVVYAVPPSAEDRFLPTAAGARLMAVPFDAAAGLIVGDRVPMVERVNAVPLFGTADFAVSRTGVLAFVPDTGVVRLGSGGGGGGVAAPLVWVEPDGTVEPLATPGPYLQAHLSPDGESVLLVMPASGSTGSDLWIREVGSGTPERLTFDGVSGGAAWTPDGEEITFARAEGGIHVMPGDRSGPAEELIPAGSLPPWAWPACWDPTDRQRLLISSKPRQTSFDVSVVEIHGDGVEVIPVAATPADELPGCFSPDGDWISYVSDESGPAEVYVRPASGDGPRRQISRGGGGPVLWSPDGTRLLYRSQNRMMAVEVTTDPTFRILGDPEPLWEAGADGPVQPGFQP